MITFIRTTVRNATELQAQATGQLLLEDWQRSGETVETFLQNISPHFDYPLSLLLLDSFELNKSNLGRMQYVGVFSREFKVAVQHGTRHPNNTFFY